MNYLRPAALRAFALAVRNPACGGAGGTNGQMLVRRHQPVPTRSTPIFLLRVGASSNPVTLHHEALAYLGTRLRHRPKDRLTIKKIELCI